MMGVWVILKNNFRRAYSNKNYVTNFLIMSCLSLILAVYFTSHLKTDLNIAWVTSSNDIPKISSYSNIEILKETPSKSELVMNKYDAVVIEKGNKKYEVNTIKGKDFKAKIENFIKNPSEFNPNNENENKRGVGTNILGYMLMFILLQGVFFMSFFTEDKENKAFKRIITSPIYMRNYIAGHCIFNFIIVYVPILTMLFIIKQIFKIDIGFSYSQYGYLLGIIVLFSVAFSLFISTVVEKMDDVMSLSSSIIVLTSIFSGSFYSINNTNIFLKKLINLLPQKNYLDLAQGIESGKPIMNYVPQIGYLLTLVILLYGCGIIICKRKFNEGRY
ncbi:ABC-type multidrug transport system, permease component [Gottschalkia purinilytica]|uniref:ABC-type multidrug transport system, permease component n=1 Tax=Gottschalkia purinilytica TaxID=1503 RepID=A0A0L0WAF6_GOTPU|nr:ABC transporter permease [Gottschalkia purinilytica]KNF08305.1 ABC-type multidrug transport system, permease component [Gottschalkia purinilytica]